jgi:hypothetical protein
VEVLYYGHGEGTWPMGKPGLLALFHVEHSDGRREEVATGADWLCRVDRAHKPGQYRRWFLRALQEEFDARRHPHGWDTPAYKPDPTDWVPAMEFQSVGADHPPFASGYPDYAGDSRVVDRAGAALRPRSIPLLRETLVSPARLAEAGRVAWRRDPDDWFENRMPGALEATRDDAVAKPAGEGAWTLPATRAGEGVFATFEWTEQGVGWPTLVVDAAEGTVVELMCQEAHDPAKTAWLDTQFFCWSRFVCREGENRIEPFDFESFRWLQIHVRDAARPVNVRNVAMRRRVYPWPASPEIACSEAPLQRLFDASVNTLHNCAQETCVDGMARERQQYSGDVGHQLHPVRQSLGGDALAARFLTTYGHGISLDGYFMDSWPAYDRLARIAQKQVGASYWGPILDHGVGFCFDAYHHWMQTGDLEAVREPYPALLKFAGYLTGLIRREEDGLLPVEDIGVCNVWIDHEAYQTQAHRRCAWNLYASAMLTHALAPLARAFGDAESAARLTRAGRALHKATVRQFWDPGREQFVVNLPQLRAGTEEAPRLCDRSAATALMYDLAPNGKTGAMVAALASPPAEMGLSYPANAPWRFWALGRHGRADAVLAELRAKWVAMPSVLQNNTLAEFFAPAPDSTNQWSHCPIAPLIALHQVFAGVAPLAPGYARVAVRPQLADLPDVAVTTQTPRGPLRFEAAREGTGHRGAVTLPAGVEGELHLPAQTAAPDGLEPIGAADRSLGLRRYRLSAGVTTQFTA